MPVEASRWNPSAAAARSPLPVLLITVLTGCAAVAPERQLPEPPVELPATWMAAPEGTVAAAPADRWWQSFGDPLLDELVAEVLDRSYDLAAAAARLEQAEAQARIAGAPRLPQAGAGLDGSRARQSFIGFPIPGSERQVLSTTTTTLGVSLNVSWEVDLWGRLAAAERAALADLQAAEADYAAARLSLAGQTVKAWLAVTEAAEQVELAATTLENRESVLRRIRRRYEAGLSPGLDLRLARINRAAAEALLAQRRRQLDVALRQLDLLLARYPAAAAAVGRLPELPPPPPVGLPAELLIRRPDLAAAERRLATAGARVAEARAALYPRLSLTGAAGRRSQDLEDLLDNDFSVWSLAAGLLQPIFQGGRLRAGVDLAEARAEELLAGYARTVLGAFAEVETALAAEELLEDQVAALAAAAEEAIDARRQAEERYAAGLVDVLTVLETQRQALDAESQLIDARRRRLESRVDLHLALGGGFESGKEILNERGRSPAS